MGEGLYDGHLAGSVTRNDSSSMKRLQEKFTGMLQKERATMGSSLDDPMEGSESVGTSRSMASFSLSPPTSMREEEDEVDFDADMEDSESEEIADLDVMRAVREYHRALHAYHEPEIPIKK